MRLKGYEKELDSSFDKEEDQIEEVVSQPPSILSSGAGSHSDGSNTPPIRKIIRFEDGDPQNPDNWRQV